MDGGAGGLQLVAGHFEFRLFEAVVARMAIFLLSSCMDRFS